MLVTDRLTSMISLILVPWLGTSLLKSILHALRTFEEYAHKKFTEYALGQSANAH